MTQRAHCRLYLLLGASLILGLLLTPAIVPFPLPAGTAYVLSSRRNFVPSGVPAAFVSCLLELNTAALDAVTFSMVMLFVDSRAFTVTGPARRVGFNPSTNRIAEM